MTITKKHVFSLVFLFIFGVIQLAVFSLEVKPVRADDSLFNSQIGMDSIGKTYGDKKTDVRVVVARLILIVLSFLATIFLALIIYAGFRYMTAAGNQEQVSKAVSQIRDAAIGLLIIIASWALTFYIFQWVSKAVSNSNNLVN